VRILLVEDEIKVGAALKKGLQAEEYEVTWAQTGEEGFFHASSQLFDLIVLDVMLPGRDGIEVLQTLRKQGSKTPVLLLTAKDAIEDRVLGLDAGADDYLVKLGPSFVAISQRLPQVSSPLPGLKSTRSKGRSTGKVGASISRPASLSFWNTWRATMTALYPAKCWPVTFGKKAGELHLSTT
jgi:CheY-like chemotaxis protein